MMRVKKELKNLDMTDLDFSEGTKIFVNESLCPYYRWLWSVCKKLRERKYIHSFFTSNGTIKVMLSENGRAHSITHDEDLKKLLPECDFSDI